MTVSNDLIAPDGSSYIVRKVDASALAIARAGEILACDTTASGFAVQLPDGQSVGTCCVVADDADNFLVNPVEVSVVGGGTIDGEAVFVMNTNGQATQFMWTGEEWSRVQIERAIFDARLRRVVPVRRQQDIVNGSPLVGGGAIVGAFADRPAAGAAGRLFIPTDTVAKIWVDDGDNWRPIVDAVLGTQPPEASTWTLVKASGRATTFTDAGGTLAMKMTNGVAGADDIRIAKRAAPGAFYRMTVHMLPALEGKNYSSAGVVWRESATGKIQCFGVVWNNNTIMLVLRNETASDAGAAPTFAVGADLIALASHPEVSLASGLWLQLEDDHAATRTARYSSDGVHFIDVASTPRATTLTPDEIGLFVAQINTAGAATQAAALFDSVLID